MRIENLSVRYAITQGSRNEGQGRRKMRIVKRRARRHIWTVRGEGGRGSAKRI